MAAPVDDIKDINRFGLSEVYPRTNAPTNVDIVFVHGLNGDPHRTWTSEQTKVFWPAQLLPPLLEEENARVLVYGYDSEVTSFTDGVSKDKIHNHAESLVAALAANRRLRKATERPIIFVAHSLGGLVVKRGLIYSSEIRGPKTEHLRSIFVSTYGILFLGTPHKGSDVAQWGSRLEWICNAVMPKKIIDTQPQLVEALKTNNETLQNIDRQFIQLMSRFYIYFFHEAKPTNLKGTFRFIVEEDSASPNVQDVERAGIQADHSHMCKFESDSSPGFDLVAEGIQRYAEEAPAIIKTRWIQERKASEAQKQAAVEEIIPGFGSMSGPAKGTPDSGSSEFATLGNSLEDLPLSESTLLRNAQHTTNAADAIELPSKLAEPYFIVPPGFRPNTFFVGMDRELKELDRRLFDGRRRSEGTACVLIHGQPGAGKSHLARQYVNKNRKKFDGGIFWINARLREEIYQAYWNIAQKVVLRDSPHLRLTADGNERSFEDIVKTWFEARRQWLIVFDGIAVDKDDDAAELQSFIPDSEDSSIIYVSRASNLGTKQRLLRPFPIKVHALKEDDARKLIFKELHIKKPTEAEVKSAAELVKKMGGLPLAIHAISHRLGDTHEPLTKYNMKSYSADPKLGATYNGIMDDLQRLGHQGAWNLINLICFYGPHLPVELIRIGIKVLRHSDIEVKSSENGEKPDLNTTFGVLMRYALIERNEPDEGDSASSSRDSLIGPEPIDMLKMHSVAQKFCCDALNAATILPQWLGYAVDVFCESFRQADGKIKAKPQAGR
ncbi:hypothetical protein MMC08_006745, partial [Hypocenomyce scalaris]|nr:hypothetical protein [Hypocenomyce scalaris]